MSHSLDNSQAQGLDELEHMKKALKESAELALDYASKKGADAVKVVISSGVQKRLVVEAGEFTLANTLASSSLAVAVHKDKRKGTASINIPTAANVKKAIDDALVLASYSVPDPNLTLASLEQAPKAAPLGFLFDATLAQMDLLTLQQHMQEILGVLKQDKRLALDRFESSLGLSYHGLYNSHGVMQEDQQSMCDWSFFGMAREGEQVTGFDYDGDSTYQIGGLLEKAMKSATAFREKLVKQLNPEKCSSYRGKILLTPRAVQEILFDLILFHASGRSVMDQKSRWNDKVGEKVLDSSFTLIDRPHDPRFSGATSYDGDGLPTREQTIIDQGVLSMHLHDLYSAKKTKATSTATAGGPFALELKAGQHKLADLLESEKQLLVVDRFSGNSDYVKGDFSGVAKSSRFYTGSQKSVPVTETMISANFFDVIKKPWLLSDTSEVQSSQFASPYVLIDDVSVTAG